MMSPRELWPDIQNGNHREARTARLNRLNGLLNRVTEWISVLGDSPNGGPTKAEMAGIVNDLNEYIGHEVAPESD